LTEILKRGYRKNPPHTFVVFEASLQKSYKKIASCNLFDFKNYLDSTIRSLDNLCVLAMKPAMPEITFTKITVGKSSATELLFNNILNLVGMME